VQGIGERGEEACKSERGETQRREREVTTRHHAEQCAEDEGQDDDHRHEDGLVVSAEVALAELHERVRRVVDHPVANRHHQRPSARDPRRELRHPEREPGREHPGERSR
jgi:hypothetical protein